MADPAMHVYRLKGWLRAIYLILGFGIFGIGAVGGYANMMRPDKNDGPSIIFLLLAPAFLGAYLIAVAVRSKLVIEGTRIEVQYAFHNRSADLSEIEGFRTVSTRNGSYWRFVRKDGQRGFSVLQSFAGNDELRAWFQQLTDMDDRDGKVLLEKIEQDQELGATPEDRLAALKRAKSWNIGLSCVTIAAAIGLLAGGASLRFTCVSVLALAPAVVLYRLNKEPLLFALFKAKRDPRTDLGVGFIVSCVGLMLTNESGHFVSIAPLIPYMALVVLLGGLGLKNAVRSNQQFWGALFGGVLFVGMYAFGLVSAVNQQLDKSNATLYAASVTGMHATKGRSTSYYLELEPWGPEQRTSNLSVSSATYARTQVGDTVCLALRSGALHAAWYRQIHCPAGGVTQLMQ